MVGIRRTKRRDGALHPRVRGWYVDWTGKRKWFSGTHDEEGTLAMARRLEDDHRQIRLGYRPPPKASDKPRRFTDVVQEYLAWGQAQGGRGGKAWSNIHAAKRQRHLTWWQERLLLQSLSDLDGCLPAVEAALRNLHSDGRTGKTVQNYAEALAAFCDWCVERGYLDDDPLKRLKAYDTTPKAKRRALSLDEVRRLLRACDPARRLLYEVALVTGLRVNELRHLTPGHLDVASHGLRLDAAWTKNRKSDFQPLPTKLVERLVKSSTGKTKAAPLLSMDAHPERTLGKDLKRVGIPKETPEGKVDFAALRTTFATLVVESGANVKEAQTLMRHSTPQLTMNTYARTRADRLHGVAEAVQEMVNGKLACATGVQRKDRARRPDAATTRTRRHLRRMKSGVGEGTRTPNPVSHSHVL